MSNTTDILIKKLADTITEISKIKVSSYDTEAEVKRVEGDIAWVHIPGGVDETPVQLTTNAKKGDVVKVRVSGGKAWITGNATSPPTDDTKAIEVENNVKDVFVNLDNRIRTGILESSNIFKAEYEQAIAEATNLICGGAGGYVITTLNDSDQPIELLITDNLDIDSAINVWRWNLGGLGYSSMGYEGPYTTAITQNGAIVADFITTGTLTANIIKAGTISDWINKNYWNLETGNFVTTQGNIAGWTIQNNQLYAEDYVSSYSQYNYMIVSPNLFEAKTKLNNHDYIVQIKEGEIYSYYDTTLLSRFSAAFGSEACSSLGCYKAFVLIPAAGGSTAFRYAGYSGGNGNYGAPFYFGMNVKMSGALTVTGTKSREVETDNYDERLLYCYETPTPMFADIGEAILDEDGICYVEINDIFSETIADKVEYYVFLQNEGRGESWVEEKHPRYFVINGTPNLKVAWELKAAQKDYEFTRLERSFNNLDEYDEYYYISDDSDNISNEYILEQEELLYG